MIIRVSELQADGLAIEDVAAVGAFDDPGWRLDALTLHVAPDGRDVLVTGRIRARVPLTCGRCLETFVAAVNPEVDVRLVPRPAAGDSVELGAADLDVDFYQNDQLDVSALVAAETTLALPMKPLCRHDCRGLCPVCGGNRNAVACACDSRPPDPRLATLGRLASRPHP